MTEEPRATSAVPVRRGGGFDLEAMRAKAARTVVTPAVTHPAVAAIFDPARDDKLEVPYVDQGDPSMYTAGNLKARKALRSNAAIKDAIKRVRR
jgi:hypothetical protein